MVVNKKHIWVLIVLGLFTRLIFIWHPAETVFDEVHFGKFIGGYITGQYFFDIHPPLGKLIMTEAAQITGFNTNFSFEKIGLGYNDNTYIILRLLPALFGAFLPLIIYLLALEIGIRQELSFLVALFIVFENALIAQSRLMLLDAFLLFFSFSALLFYFKSRNSNRWAYTVLSAISCGMAISVKWTGLSFLGVLGFLEIISLGKSIFRNKNKILTHMSRLALLATVPFIIYFSFFVLHFKLLPRTGPGDAFMTPLFQKTLIGNSHADDPLLEDFGLWKKFTELNREMYLANQRLTARHPYGSKWYTWPLMIRTVYYWNKEMSPGIFQKIYLIGNPFIWWISTVGILSLIFLTAKQTIKFLLRKEKLDQVYRTACFVISAYFINLLPFIGIKRVMFLYHYFPSYIFAILTLMLTLQLLSGKDSQKNSLTKWFIATAVLLFIIFSPLTYGISVSPKYFDFLIWLPSWL